MHKWSKVELAALDLLLTRFSLAEINTKAKTRGRRKIGRPEYNAELYGVTAFVAIEQERYAGRTISEAAELAAKRTARWKKPVAAKTLIRVHRDFCRSVGIKPKDRNKALAMQLQQVLRPVVGLGLSQFDPDLHKK